MMIPGTLCKRASVSSTMRGRAISVKFSTLRVFKQNLPYANMRVILNPSFFANNAKHKISSLCKLYQREKDLATFVCGIERL